MAGAILKKKTFEELQGFTAEQGKILLVDDDRTLRALMAMQLEYLGYEVVEASNGHEAYDILTRNSASVDIVLLDREMPIMNGMQLIGKIKSSEQAFRNIPIVMITGSGAPQQITQGLESGVFYYLVKPVNYDVLSVIVSSAMEEAQRLRKIQELRIKNDTSLAHLTNGYFTVQTLEEGEYLTKLLSQCYEDPERVSSGISALITNAIEHGNLEIGFENKARLLHQGQWVDEVQDRQSQSGNQDKKVHVTYQKTPEYHRLIVRDEGRGFDWKSYMPANAARATALNGRGILQAMKVSFDELKYNPEGNIATAVNYIFPTKANG